MLLKDRNKKWVSTVHPQNNQRILTGCFFLELNRFTRSWQLSSEHILKRQELLKRSNLRTGLADQIQVQNGKRGVKKYEKQKESGRETSIVKMRGLNKF